MKRAEARDADERAEERQRNQDRSTSTLVIGACLIAAVRLARTDSISRSSPRLNLAIVDSVRLAREILDQVLRG